MIEHELDKMLNSTFKGLKDIVDIKTIIGDTITTPDGTTVIPFSRASFGYGMGGYGSENSESSGDILSGGSGGGVTIQPIGFLIISDGDAKVIRIDDSSPVEKALDVLPDAINSIAAFFKK